MKIRDHTLQNLMDIALAHEDVAYRLEAIETICTRISSTTSKQIFQLLEFLTISDESIAVKCFSYKHLKQHFPLKKLRSIKEHRPIFGFDSIKTLMEDNGAENIDYRTVCSLITYLSELLSEIIKKSIELSRHEGRKSVLVRFVDIAISITTHHRFFQSSRPKIRFVSN